MGNLILKAAGKPCSAAMFWKLLVGTVIMLTFGYLGEIQTLPKIVGFIGGLCGWGLIVTIGWAIYPAGYLCGLLIGNKGDVYLNVIYNIADFVNKIAFVCSCWSCAKSDSADKGQALLP